MSEIGIREIRSYLSSKSAGELIDEIILLTETFPEIKEFYQVKLSLKGDSQAFERYKKIIRNEFFPARGFGKLRLTNIRRAISDYKKNVRCPGKKGRVAIVFRRAGGRVYQ